MGPRSLYTRTASARKLSSTVDTPRSRGPWVGNSRNRSHPATSTGGQMTLHPPTAVAVMTAHEVCGRIGHRQPAEWTAQGQQAAVLTPDDGTARCSGIPRQWWSPWRPRVSTGVAIQASSAALRLLVVAFGGPPVVAGVGGADAVHRYLLGARRPPWAGSCLGRIGHAVAVIPSTAGWAAEERRAPRPIRVVRNWI